MSELRTVKDKIRHARSNGIVVKKSEKPVIKNKLSAALQPPNRVVYKLIVRPQLPPPDADTYESYVKYDKRVALEELKKKRLLMFPNYDVETYVYESEPQYVYYLKHGYTRVRFESDYWCNTSFCLGTCSRCDGKTDPTYYWMKGDHRVKEDF